VALGSLAALAVAGGGAAASGSGSSAQLTLSRPLPGLVRQTRHVLVRGETIGSPRHTRVALELKRIYPAGSPWGIVASTPVAHDGAFTLQWRVPKSEQTGPVSLRVVALHRGTVIATTATAQSAIGPAPVYCDKPVPPTVDIPAGDGWIVGGRYVQGGPYPGLYACDSQPYTVTATDSHGQQQASQSVAGGHSYTLAPLPAGTYTLKSDFCAGTATVRAGKQTVANTYCDVP
jgi:hypothetical protein